MQAVGMHLQMTTHLWKHLQVGKQLLQRQVGSLDAAAAIQLFRQAAGLEGAPEAALHEVEAAILEACGGLPLAVQLMGGQLYADREQANWQVIHSCCLNLPQKNTDMMWWVKQTEHCY
jgi:hypothetical protein